MTVFVQSVMVGKISPLGSRRVPSGIDKQPATGEVEVRRSGLVGDEQGDLKNHGGFEKAVHHYPYDHYARWSDELPHLTTRLTAAGAFGENILTEGVTEKDVCIGDIYRLGTALVQVSQGRQPCWRLNERFGDRAMARRVQESRRTGWYYRILEEGRVGAGDSIDLIDRPAKDWSLDRIMNILYQDTLNFDDLAGLSELRELSDSWRMLAQRRLTRRVVEDWSQRLTTSNEISRY